MLKTSSCNTYVFHHKSRWKIQTIILCLRTKKNLHILLIYSKYSNYCTYTTLYFSFQSLIWFSSPDFCPKVNSGPRKYFCFFSLAKKSFNRHKYFDTFFNHQNHLLRKTSKSSVENSKSSSSPILSWFPSPSISLTLARKFRGN